MMAHRSSVPDCALNARPRVADAVERLAVVVDAERAQSPIERLRQELRKMKVEGFRSSAPAGQPAPLATTAPARIR
jgi:hypothetical protein